MRIIVENWGLNMSLNQTALPVVSFCCPVSQERKHCARVNCGTKLVGVTKQPLI